MKRTSVYALLAVLACAQAPVLSQRQAPTRDAVDIPKSEILKTIANAPKQTSSDQNIRVVDIGGYNVAVGVVHRPVTTTPQGSLSHTKVTEIYYVLEGSGTLVTGGTIPNATDLDPNSFVTKTAVGPTRLGQVIEGGRSRQIGPGDVVVVPQGVPHWFTKVDSPITFLEFRTDVERVLQSGYYLFENK